MKALVKYATGIGNVGIREVPDPSPGPGEVKIEIKAAGICGTDMHIYYDEFKTIPPVVMGHELSGVVVEVGPGVSRCKVGDRVTAETYASTCMKCRYCRSGEYNLCPSRMSIGSKVNGAFAKYLVIREENIHKLPENLDFEAAALTEPLACCVHAVIEETSIRSGDVVVISGPGIIGLLCMQLAKAGGGIVIVCGTRQDESRLELARKLGADRTVNVESEDVQAVVESLTDGYGADVVIECAGAGPSAQACIEMVRRKGRYAQVGLFGKPVEFDLEQVAYKELIVTGGNASTRSSWERAIRLLEQGKVVTEPLITDKLPLSHWEEGFRRFQERKGGKILLIP